MTSTKHTKAREAYIKRSTLSDYFFTWTNHLIKDYHEKKEIDYNDLIDIPENQMIRKQLGLFSDQLAKSKKDPFYALQRLQLGRFVEIFFLQFSYIFVSLLYIKLMDIFSKEEKTQTLLERGSIAISIILLHLAYIVSCQRFWFRGSVAFFITRKVLISLIFCSVLTQSALTHSFTQNKVNELLKLNSEIDNLKNFYFYSHSLIIAPLSALYVFYCLWDQIGVYLVFGLVTLLGLILFQFVFGNYLLYVKRQYKQKRDERLMYLKEVIDAIRNIKIENKDQYFVQKLIEKKEIEYKVQKKFVLLNSLNTSIYECGGILIALSVLGPYSIYRKLHSRVILTTYSFFHLLSALVTKNINASIKGFIDFKYFKRLIYGYFKKSYPSPTVTLSIEADDNQKDIVNSGIPETSPQYPSELDSPLISLNRNSHPAIPYAIRVEAGTNARFDPNIDDFALVIDKQLEIPKGVLVGVTGKNGSGKSAFFHLILGEMKLVSGNLEVDGSIGFCNQEPFVIRGTLRNNLIFNNEYDTGRYLEALEACELIHDISKLSNLDQAMLGDGGSNLSGGQRTRLAMARAYYSDQDIYLFDDTFSSIDNYISRKIFKNLIREKLQNKTRLLITNNREFLKGCDMVLSLKDGKPLLKWNKRETRIKKKDSCDGYSSVSSLENFPNSSLTSTSDFLTNIEREQNRELEKQRVEQAILHNKAHAPPEKQGGIWQDESLFEYIVKYMGITNIVIITSLIVIEQYVSVSFNFTIKDSDKLVKELGLPGALGRIFQGCITVLLATCLTNIMSDLLLLYRGKKHHDRAVRHILYAPLSYFDKTSIGSILDLLTFDQKIVDEDIPSSLMGCLKGLAKTLTSLCISIYFAPGLVFGAMVFFFVCAFIYRRARLPIQQTIRLKKQYQNELSGFAYSIITGISTIRSYKACGYFKQKLFALLERGYQSELSVQLIYSWMGIHSEFLVHLLLIAVLITMTLSREFDDSSSIMMTCRYLVDLISAFQLAFVLAAHLEGIMFHAKKLIDCRRIIPEEKIFKRLPIKEVVNTKSEIVVKDLTMKYKTDMIRPIGATKKEVEGNWVLKDINFEIKRGEKIGLIGTSGSGKSTLINVLSRLVPYQKGKIYFQGKELKNFHFRETRQLVGYVSQTPQLLPGSVKDNLMCGTDDEISAEGKELLSRFQIDLEQDDLPLHNKSASNNVLHDHDLHYTIRRFQDDCQHHSYPTAAEASADLRRVHSLSRLGEPGRVPRVIQTVSRVTLSNSFSVMDEYTGVLILVAHRLANVMHFDKIYIMKDGEVIESGIPFELLANHHGERSISKKTEFAKMVLLTDQETQDLLFKKAKNAYLAKSMKSSKRKPAESPQRASTQATFEITKDFQF